MTHSCHLFCIQQLSAVRVVDFNTFLLWKGLPSSFSHSLFCAALCICVCLPACLFLPQSELMSASHSCSSLVSRCSGRVFLCEHAGVWCHGARQQWCRAPKSKTVLLPPCTLWSQEQANFRNKKLFYLLNLKHHRAWIHKSDIFIFCVTWIFSPVFFSSWPAMFTTHVWVFLVWKKKKNFSKLKFASWLDTEFKTRQNLSYKIYF